MPSSCANSSCQEINRGWLGGDADCIDVNRREHTIFQHQEVLRAVRPSRWWINFFIIRIETTHPIIYQANHKINGERLRSWSVTLKDQKVRVKEVCQKKHAKWCHCHATKHCSIEFERITMVTSKPDHLGAVTSSQATQRYAARIECQHGLISLNSRMSWTLQVELSDAKMHQWNRETV